MTIVRVRKKERFGVVPDRILEEGRLSPEARAVASWLEGRDDGFVIRVEVMRERFLKISAKRWRKIRTELENIGWWRSTKTKDLNQRAKFVWHHEFCSEPNVSIPPFGTDGGGTPGGSTDTGSDPYQNGSCNQKECIPPPTLGPEAIDELVEAAVWIARQGENPPRSPRWAAAVKKRLATTGPNRGDLEALTAYQNAKKADDRLHEIRDRSRGFVPHTESELEAQKRGAAMLGERGRGKIKNQ